MAVLLVRRLSRWHSSNECLRDLDIFLPLMALPSSTPLKVFTVGWEGLLVRDYFGGASLAHGITLLHISKVYHMAFPGCKVAWKYRVLVCPREKTSTVRHAPSVILAMLSFCSPGCYLSLGWFVSSAREHLRCCRLPSLANSSTSGSGCCQWHWRGWFVFHRLGDRLQWGSGGVRMGGWPSEQLELWLLLLFSKF